MEAYLTVLLAVSISCACFHIITTTLTRLRSLFPPGPYPFPIIGNILELGPTPHISLANLSKKYGHVMSLKLGSITTVVFSSPTVAKEVLQKHDFASSNREIPNSFRALDHDKVSMALLPAGKEWRHLRKLCKEQMFAQAKLEANQSLRLKKAEELVDYIGECCIKGEPVDVGKAAFTTTLNLISNTLFSTDFANHNSVSSREFMDIVTRIAEISAAPNVADYFPIFRRIDPQGIKRKMGIYYDKLLKVFGKIIDERLNSRSGGTDYARSNDVLESLLDLSEKLELNYNVMKHLLLDLFIAGTDTTAMTLEFAMAELIKNPKKMAKARAELKEVIGSDRLLQETDISKLPYLQALVKETFRLHPVAPLLVPHKTNEDIQVGGYTVPKNAQILVNVWAIGHDSNVWHESESFMPERFLGSSKVDYQGQDFELIPFGSGRRICPGLPLAHRMVHIMLGSFIQFFDWKLEEGMRLEDVNMGERFGLVVHLAKPLKAIPIKI